MLLPTDHRCAAHDEVERLQKVVAEQGATIIAQAAIIAEQAAVIEALKAEVAKLREELESLKRRTLGPKSERLPSVENQLKSEPPKTRTPRISRRDLRADVPKEIVRRRVLEPERNSCPCCGCKDVTDVSRRQNTIYESIPAQVVQRTYIDEVILFACGHEVTSEKPVKVTEGGDYGPNFVAESVIAKCEDSFPQYRQAKRYTRLGLPISRSTLTDLFHQSAFSLKAIYARLLELVALATLVQADETSIRVQALKKCRTAFMWVFLNASVIVYRFSTNRSGDTPRKVLRKAEKGEQKTILVDAFTGYNKVVKLDGWERAGCKAHGRRKFFEAGGQEGVEALGFFLDMYRVEHIAKKLKIKGTAEHLALRREKALPIFRKFHRWLIRQRPHHGPRTQLGRAIRYALKNRRAWMKCFRDSKIPLDNNASEAALRVIALLRKNALFLGHDESGENHAILLSLIATCKLHGVNPQHYLADVLLRVQTHPMSRIDDLLPQNWKALFALPALATAA